ncbi:hypothetical protein CSC94_19895 [Zhengella mangrovi]|uniref:Uncharacterized protein n=1 Tax=Zhengella mangrovi TaxID=1982044 RepID=A0A2G1QIP0_9HYPH|nr:hypothetical protein [Zhengella mangrovi]PHP65385.1 hypothetical protein CSC94_19895 [Zhengella mangrovi]
MHLVAKIVVFLEVAILGAAGGALMAFYGVILLGMLTGSSNMNGGLAMGAAGIAPLGAVAGALGGVWLAWKIIRESGKRIVLGLGYGLAAVCLVAVGGWFLVQEMTDGDPYEPGKEPLVHLEWRLPDKVRHDQVDRVFRQMMRSSHMNWILSDWWDEPRARDEGDRTVLRMVVQIRWRVTGRTFQLWRAPDHDNRITVDLGLPRDPKASADYGPWREVEGYPGNEFRWRIERG